VCNSSLWLRIVSRIKEVAPDTSTTLTLISEDLLNVGQICVICAVDNALAMRKEEIRRSRCPVLNGCGQVDHSILARGNK